MKLAAKGRYAPPPSLPQHAQRVAEIVASWPKVHARTHWELGDETIVDGADFYFGDDPDAEELGHLHLYAEAHVAMPAKLAATVIAAGLGERFAYSRQIVVFDVDSKGAVPHATWLFQLSYDHRNALRPMRCWRAWRSWRRRRARGGRRRSPGAAGGAGGSGRSRHASRAEADRLGSLLEMDAPDVARPRPCTTLCERRGKRREL